MIQHGDFAWFYWLGAGALAGLTLCAFAIALRTGWEIWHYGFRAWLKRPFRIDPETFRFVGVLFLLVAAAVAFGHAVGISAPDAWSSIILDR